MAQHADEGAVRELRGSYAGAMRELCGSYAGATRELRGSYAGAMQELCGSSPTSRSACEHAEEWDEDVGVASCLHDVGLAREGLRRSGGIAGDELHGRGGMDGPAAGEICWRQGNARECNALWSWMGGVSRECLPRWRRSVSPTGHVVDMRRVCEG
jgi:hypothetical protein